MISLNFVLNTIQSDCRILLATKIIVDDLKQFDFTFAFRSSEIMRLAILLCLVACAAAVDPATIMAMIANSKVRKYVVSWWALKI